MLAAKTICCIKMLIAAAWLIIIQIFDSHIAQKSDNECKNHMKNHGKICINKERFFGIFQVHIQKWLNPVYKSILHGILGPFLFIILDYDFARRTIIALFQSMFRGYVNMYENITWHT